MLLKGAISSNNNPQGHDDGGHPDHEVSERLKSYLFPHYTEPGMNCPALFMYTCP